ncbi:MAG: hypothetical protein HYX90_12335 [Chloroflexi bacterium]|nr:hypothetical protein [Chloroflexota bacterium]
MTATRSIMVLVSLALLTLLVLAACQTSAPPSPSPSTVAKASPSVTATSKAATSPTVSPAPKPASTSASPSFAGKTITIVVGSTAGGGSDTVARIQAKYLTRLLPGNPTIVVRAMPGGAATIAANYVYTSKPDGLTLLAASAGTQLGQLLGISAARYDVLKMPVLLGMKVGGVVFTWRKNVAKPEDILKAKGLIYGGGAGSASTYLFMAAHQLLDFPVEKAVLGYAGASEARRAFLSGETNMQGDSGTSYISSKAAYEEKGGVTLLFQNGNHDEKGNLFKSADLPPETLGIWELYEKLYSKTLSGVVWDSYRAIIAASRDGDSLLYLPPGTPESIVRVYWDAATAMIKDPEFLKTMGAQVGVHTPWAAGQAWDKAFKLNFVIKPEIREWLRATLPKYGMVVE